MTTLVTAADIKDRTTVSRSADDEKLNKAVPDAETRHLRPLLGAALFGQLLAFVASAPTPPAVGGLSATAEAAALAPYKVLLDNWRTAHPGPLLRLWDAVKPCLCQWALYDAWPDILVHVENAGVTMKTGNANGTTSAEAGILNQARDNHRNKAVWRGSELAAWLDSNKTDYPAYEGTRPPATGRQPLGGISLD